MGISFKMGKWSVCGVYASLKPMIHFDSKQSQSIFNQNYYKNALANNCKQCSILIINHTTTPLPKAYDCVAVYIAGRRTSLVVYGWWPQPPTKKNYWWYQRNWLSPLWSNTYHWPYAAGVCIVTGMSWWILHSRLVECSLRDNSWDLHSRIPARSGILLSDMM